MTAIDYKKVGFRCGLEIHQQTDTLKLFCNCPSIVHDESPTIHIKRGLRPVAGEDGHIDPAALYEATKGRYFIYEACPTSSCLVELDEEPPGPINPEALNLTVQVAKMMNCKIVDEVRPMRKIVIDGSNVSGFQRTCLIGMNGWIETSRGKVGIPTLCLEEEAAQKAGETKDCVTFRLDRLGVPLIEIATDTSIIDPEHAKEAAEKIGMILRSTGNVKRGIGTIRQDVNVSIAGGARIEIKGFQELKSIPSVIDFEIKRQLGLLSSGKEIKSEVRKAEADLTTSFLRPMPGAKRMYPETDVNAVRLDPEYVKSVPIPTLLSDQVGELAKGFGLDKDLAATLVNDGLAIDFEGICKSCKNLKPAYIADTMLSGPKQASKKAGREINVSGHDWKILFIALDAGKASKESVQDIIASGKPIQVALESFKGMSDEDLEQEIKKIASSNPGMPFNALIGVVMTHLRGKADGKKISELTRKFASK